MITSPDDEWLGNEDLAGELKLPIRTIYAWRNKGTGPKGVRLGRHVRYRRSDVEAWIASQYAEEGA